MPTSTPCFPMCFCERHLSIFDDFSMKQSRYCNLVDSAAPTRLQGRDHTAGTVFGGPIDLVQRTANASVATHRTQGRRPGGKRPGRGVIDLVRGGILGMSRGPNRWYRLAEIRE